MRILILFFLIIPPLISGCGRFSNIAAKSGTSESKNKAEEARKAEEEKMRKCGGTLIESCHDAFQYVPNLDRLNCGLYYEKIGPDKFSQCSPPGFYSDLDCYSRTRCKL